MAQNETSKFWDARQQGRTNLGVRGKALIDGCGGPKPEKRLQMTLAVSCIQSSIPPSGAGVVGMTSVVRLVAQTCDLGMTKVDGTTPPTPPLQYLRVASIGVAQIPDKT